MYYELMVDDGLSYDEAVEELRRTSEELLATGVPEDKLAKVWRGVKGCGRGVKVMRGMARVAVTPHVTLLPTTPLPSKPHRWAKPQLAK
jgi:hypothetical protein